MPEIRVSSTRRDNQVIVGNFCVRSLHNSALEIESCNLGHQHLDILVGAKNGADRGRDLARRQASGRDLIEKWLKGVEVLAIDHGDLQRGLA